MRASKLRHGGLIRPRARYIGPAPGRKRGSQQAMRVAQRLAAVQAAAAAGRASISRPASFDHFVGRGHQRRRNGEAEGFRGLQIEDSLKRVGCSIGRSPGLAASQDLVDIADRAAEIIGEIRSIRQQQVVGTCSAVSASVGTLCAMAEAPTCTPLIVHRRASDTRAVETVAGNGRKRCSISSDVFTSNIRV